MIDEGFEALAAEADLYEDAMPREEQIVRAVWDWIVSVNNGSGLDAGDLAAAMEQVGAPCPADLEEN